MNMQTQEQNSVRMFLELLGRSKEIRENMVPTSSLPELYAQFCKSRSIEPLPPERFLDEMKALCPNFDPSRPYYALGELQAIFFIDQNENPFLSQFVSMLKPQKMWIESAPGPNQETIFFAFYKDLSEKTWPADQTVRGDDLYRLYEAFCKEYKYAIRLVPDRFWEWTKREFRDGSGEPLDWRRTYTFDELRRIITQNNYFDPF